MDSFASIPANLTPSFPPEENNSKIDDESGLTDVNTLTDDENTPYMTSKQKLELAQNLKAEGNNKFKENDISGASAVYEESLQKLAHDPSDDECVEEFRSTKVAVYSNLSLCYIKQEKWMEAKKAANSVLKIDKENIKAMYRRGYANSRLGFYDDAKDDLTQVCKRDNTNAEAYRELEYVKEKYAELKEREKKGFQGLFTRVQGLYDDREKQVQEQKEREEKKRKKEVETFEQENKLREEKGEPPFESIEKWRESLEKPQGKPQETSQENSQEKPQERPQEKPQEKSQEVPQEKPCSSTKKLNISSLEYDEEDQKIMEETKKMGQSGLLRKLRFLGYRYFDRPNQDKTILKPAPRRIEDPSAAENTIDQKKTISAWNAAGTYEEKDCSSWFKDELIKSMKRINITRPDYTFEVLDIRQTEVEAQIMVVRGSRRYLFSSDFQLSWQVELDKETITGSVNFSDVTSFASSRASNPKINDILMPDWLVDAKFKCDKPVESYLQSYLTAAYDDFKSAMLTNIQELETLFRTTL